MNISIIEKNDLSTIQNIFCHHQIVFDTVDLWKNNMYDFSLSCEDSSLFIINFSVLTDVLTVPDAFNKFIQNLNQNLHVLVCSDFDSIIQYYQIEDLLVKLDNSLDKWQVSILIDAGITDRKNFKHIQIFDNIPNKFEQSIPRLVQTNTIKDKKDYILTIGKLKLHRDLLWNKLESRNLLSKGFSVYHKSPNVINWLGSTSSVTDWNDGHPSMELYKNSNFEIVPETLYDKGWFITEKTIKPIACQLPFLIVSTVGYLEYLKSKGFRTFGHLIDESYDHESNLESRVEAIVNQIEYIIQKGSDDFRKKSAQIIETNYQNLAKIAGSWWNQVDKSIIDIITKINSSFN